MRYTSLYIDDSIYVHDGSKALAERLATDPAVSAVRAPRTYRLPEPAAGKRSAQVDSVEWGIAAIHADRVWDEYDDTGQGIVIGSIDSGVQFDHPALVSAYRGNNGDGSFSHDHNWYDPAQVCSPSLEPCDNNGHGTHTVGTMVGDDGAGTRSGSPPELSG